MNKNIKAVSALALGTAISVSAVAPNLVKANETKSTNSIKTISNSKINALRTKKITTSVDKTLQNGVAQSTTPVSIPDEKLASLIRTALSKNSSDTITVGDMATLKTLDINGKGVEKLTGLETAVNLESLSISNNAITDLEPISKLTNLKFLMAEGIGLKDLSKLSGLTGLQYLFVGKNPITETTALSNFTNLVGLDLTSTRIKTVPDISKLTNLKHLILDSTKITDISSLKVTSLGELGLSYLDIKDYSPIKDTNIQILHLDNARNFDLDIIKSLSTLVTISLDDIGITNIPKAIKNLKTREHLHNLSLSENGISDVSSLLTLPQLNQTSTGEKFNLILDGNHITDFSGFKNKPNTVVMGESQIITLPSTKINTDTLEITPQLKSFDGTSINTFELFKEGTVSNDTLTLEGSKSSLLVKGLNPGKHEVQITYNAGNADGKSNSISGTLIQKVTVSNGLDLVVTQERNGVNNTGVFVFIKPADKENNIGSIKTSQGDTLPATGGVIEVKENKELTITAVDKKDENKTLVHKESIVSIDKTGPTVELSSADSTEGKSEITISAKNETKGLSKVILPSGKEVELKDDVYSSTETVANDGIYKVSAIDRASTRINKFINVSNKDAKITISAAKTPGTEEAVVAGTEFKVDVKTGVTDVESITMPDGTTQQAGTSGVFKATANGDYTFKVKLTTGNTVDYKFTVQNIDTDEPTAHVSKSLAPDGSKRYAVNISAQDATGTVKSLEVNGQAVTGTTAKILTDKEDAITYKVTDEANNSKEYTITLDKFPTYSEIAEGLVDANMWVPIVNTGRLSATLYLDFSKLSNVKEIKTPDGKTTTETTIEYTCSKNGNYTFEVVFEDGSVYKRTVEVKGLDAGTIAGTPGTDTDEPADTDKPGDTDEPADTNKPEDDEDESEDDEDESEDDEDESEDDEDESETENGTTGGTGNNTNTGTSGDKSNPQTGDAGIKGYVIGFVSLIALAIGGVVLQKKMNKNEEGVTETEDVEDEELL